ncbi:MAG TPA: 3-dehydroquinate synthase [Ktedonobacterales bacterium]|nr:3-dehydroquinate synthase [Ktedonobacterales bacterium]
MNTPESALPAVLSATRPTRPIERIVLIGPPGGGKTTTGALVAALLGWRFVDTDATVAAAAGAPIPDLFAREGEAGFRARESAALAEALAPSHVVVATGAGVGETPANRDALRALRASSAAWVVTLTVAPEVAWRRLVGGAPTSGQGDATPGALRPMLAGADPLARLHALYARRAAWYAECDETIVGDDLTPETLAARIVASLVAQGALAGDGAAPQTRHVRLGGSGADGAAGYDAVVAWGALATLGDRLAALGLPQRLHVVADANVATLYEPMLMAGLMRAGFLPAIHRVPAGEASKSRGQLDAIYDWLAERRAERGEALLAVGGGVVGDLAGLAAATYLRGLPLVHVPTSLLAQVDASIGGKVAIDHPRGKNLIGAFYQPRLVVADPATLITLPTRQRVEGWAEVVKHGVALDAAYFETLERDADALLALRPPELTASIARSVALKAAVVEGDEREGEGGRRALLNYGHTLGHAIEAITGYSAWLHGEAVAVGMTFASRLGRRLGVTPDAVVVRQAALLTRLGLPTRADGLSAQALLATTLWDKKARGGRVRWILPTALGEAALFADVPDADVRAALIEIGANDDVDESGI